MKTQMPKMDGIELNGVIYVLETECRKAVNWALKNGRQPLFDGLLEALHLLYPLARKYAETHKNLEGQADWNADHITRIYEAAIAKATASEAGV